MNERSLITRISTNHTHNVRCFLLLFTLRFGFTSSRWVNASFVVWSNVRDVCNSVVMGGVAVLVVIRGGLCWYV